MHKDGSERKQTGRTQQKSYKVCFQVILSS